MFSGSTVESSLRLHGSQRREIMDHLTYERPMRSWSPMSKLESWIFVDGILIVPLPNPELV